MGIRITIMLDDDNSKKLRVLQAKKLKESNKSISFSRVLNDVLRKGLWSIPIAKNKFVKIANESDVLTAVHVIVIYLKVCSSRKSENS